MDGGLCVTVDAYLEATRVLMRAMGWCWGAWLVVQVVLWAIDRWTLRGAVE